MSSVYHPYSLLLLSHKCLVKTKLLFFFLPFRLILKSIKERSYLIRNLCCRYFSFLSNNLIDGVYFVIFFAVEGHECCGSEAPMHRAVVTEGAVYFESCLNCVALVHICVFPQFHLPNEAGVYLVGFGFVLAASLSMHVFPVTCYFVSIFQTVFRGFLVSDVAGKMEKAYSNAAITTIALLGYSMWVC